MENLKSGTLLIANRGEIAIRIARTAHHHSIPTLSIYHPADSTSQHIHTTTRTAALSGAPSTAYTDIAQLLQIARTHNATAVAPGYGFLSESASFAAAVRDAGLTWLGPSPHAIAIFGAKHAARAFAQSCAVPVVPGSGGLVGGVEEVQAVGERVGWPVLLKASHGGGGMGLAVCARADEAAAAFAKVARCANGAAGEGVLVEKYVSRARHVEVQVFGNGLGDAVHFGERECSVQRRHQKLVEECPSPFVVSRPELRLRERLGEAAVRLAEAAKYASVGTAEFLVDEATGEFFFLEMNTRLQVEHGVTELCYGVDLVELMLRQADAEAAGRGGLDREELRALKREGPVGAAVEVRVYAENPVRDFVPAPGLLQCVQWGTAKGFPGTSRIDTWVTTGTTITPHYDPLIAKLQHHSPTRATTIQALTHTLQTTTLQGPPTNLAFLHALLQTPRFQAGDTPTSFLATLDPPFTPHAIDVLAGGALTTVQDLPGRPSAGAGIPPSGPMDSLAFRLANLLVGNAAGTAGLEVTLAGPTLRFCAGAVVAVCGADAEAEVDGMSFPLWTRRVLRRGQVLRIGRLGVGGRGCRAYIAVRGGLPGVALYCGSKSTAPALGLGGYQGRALAAGDLLELGEDVGPRCQAEEEEEEISLPARLRPVYTKDSTLAALPGPHTTGFLAPAASASLFSTPFTVTHNASRSGIRLSLPADSAPMAWSRASGGDGGAHPSNVVEYGYAVGALNWAGDTPCLFPVDGPDFGGFVSVLSVAGAEAWKMGQLRPGDRVRFRRVGLLEALRAREGVEAFLAGVERALERGDAAFAGVEPVGEDGGMEGKADDGGDDGDDAVVARVPESEKQPAVTYRQSGDSALLVEYGDSQTFSLTLRARVALLAAELSKSSTTTTTAITKSTPCCTSLHIVYDALFLPQQRLIAHLQSLETRLSTLTSPVLQTRLITLPLSFSSTAIDEATNHYATTQRPHAPYLPSNAAYVARANGLSVAALRDLVLRTTLVAVAVGFFAGTPVCLPLDPRQRLRCAKMSPPRVGGTPAGSLGWGGGCAAVYPVEAPGGYLLLGRTVPGFRAFGGERVGPGPDVLLRPGDMLAFREVSEAELEAVLARWRAGLYVPEIVLTEFDVAAHEKLVFETRDEVSALRARQAGIEIAMAEEERASLERWAEEKKMRMGMGMSDEVGGVGGDGGDGEEGEGVVSVDAPVEANVWKVGVGKGDTVAGNQVIAVLEAMKLEIAVRVPGERVSGGEKDGKRYSGGGGGEDCEGEDGSVEESIITVERVLVRPGEMVRAGQRIALLRRG